MNADVSRTPSRPEIGAATSAATMTYCASEAHRSQQRLPSTLSLRRLRIPPMSSGSDFVSSVLRSATYEASCRLYRCPNAASAQPGGCCNRNAAASRTTHLRTESIRSARCRKREPGHSKRAGRWVAGAPNVGSVSATRGLQLGPIEHRLETIALDDSDDYFADDLAHLHVSQPCLNG